MTRKALGRGLDALFSTPSSGTKAVETNATPPAANEQLIEVDIDLIEPNPEQPRTNFDQTRIEELARSIRANGVVQPVLVRRTSAGRYQLIAGERRWRAAQLAGLKRLQAIVRDLPDDRLLAVALIENIQRAELNAIEEARAYERLIGSLGATQEEIAEQVGKDRSSVANYLRLLHLPESVQRLVETDELSMGHARAILGLESPELQVKIAGEVVKRRLSVRQTEAAVKNLSRKRTPAERSTVLENDANIRAAELKLKRMLGTQVRIRSGRTGGNIEISFTSTSDLDRIYSIIMRRTEPGSHTGTD
jgi:ParB family chromosome partitioning protein